jgi:hypothetical protein
MNSLTIGLSHAVAHSYKNRAEVERSEFCACFKCFANFLPSAIRLWSDSTDAGDDNPGGLRPDSARFKGNTAICPICETDAVIGSASGYDLTDEFLRALNAHWFTSERNAQ